MKKIYPILTLILLLFFSVDVYGAGSPTLTMSSLTSREVSIIRTTCKDINKAVYEKGRKTGIKDPDIQILTSSKDENSPNGEGTLIENVEFNVSVYNKLKQSEKEEVMEIVLIGIENSDLSQMNRTRLYNFISNSDEATSNLVRQLSDDVRADYVRAYSSMDWLWRPLSVILGCMAITLFVSLGLLISLDIAYITIPMFQLWIEAGNGEDEEKDRKVHLRVSAEARYAVRTAESSSGSRFREPMGIYFKLKIKQFMIIAICILYLVSGDIYALIGTVIDMFSEIIKS